jgi:Flp pilus assembly protein TadD
MLGALKLQRGEVAVAMSLLSEALDIDPYMASAWSTWLQALYFQGDLGMLELEIKRARELLPEEGAPLGMEGLLLAVQKDPAAAAVIAESLRRDPRQPFLRYALAILRRQEGRAEEAESLLLEEIEAGPPAIPARKALVALYAEQQRYAEQLAQLDEVFRGQPPGFLDHHSRAQVLFNLARYGEAEDDIERCIASAPDYPACAMLQANILSKLGRPDEARAAYTRALALAEALQSP